MYSKSNYKKITRYLSDESSEQERIEVEMKIKSDISFAKLVQEMRQVILIKQKPIKMKSADEKWLEIKADLTTKSERAAKLENQKAKMENSHKWNSNNNSFNLLKYAAVLLLLVGASYFFTTDYLSPVKQEVEYRIVSAQFGERLNIKLKDGTEVNLDAGSELKYPVKFGDSRDVYLKGEGYFHVAHNPEKPFYVHVDNGLVQVVGTKFNIRSWDENPSVTVTVIDGKVLFSNNVLNTPNKIFLTKNMQSTLSINGELSKPINVNSSEFLGWRNNEMRFKNASLEQILSQLERWYDLKFEVDELLKNKKNLSVNLKKTSLDNIIELLSVISNAEVIREGKKIELISKQKFN